MSAEIAEAPEQHRFRNLIKLQTTAFPGVALTTMDGLVLVGISFVCCVWFVVNRKDRLSVSLRIASSVALAQMVWPACSRCGLYRANNILV